MISVYELRLKYLLARSRKAQSVSTFKNMYLFDSGRSALYAILRLLKTTIRDPVVYVNAYTTDVVHVTIESLGLRMIPLDIDPWQFKPVDKDYRFTDNTIFIQTGLFGFPSFNKEICAHVREAGGFFLEDSCNSWGTMFESSPVGSLGDAAIFSFRVGKAFSSGGGGARFQRKELSEQFTCFYHNLRNPGKLESLRKFLRTSLDYFLFAPWVLGHISRPIRRLQSKLPFLSILSRGGVVDTEYNVDEKAISKLGCFQKKLLEKRSISFASEMEQRKTVSRNIANLLRDLPIYIPASDSILRNDWNGLFFPILLRKGDPEELIDYLRKSGFDATRFHYKVPEKSFPELTRSEYPGTFKLVDSLVCIPNTTRMIGKEEKLSEVIHNYYRMRRHE